MELFVTSVVVSIVCQIVLNTHAVEISTRSGVVIGSNHLRSRSGEVIYSFTGIPYAQPPIGRLRFKVSEPVIPWQTPFNATEKCPVCAQVKRIGSTPGKLEIIGQEDCLRLNIYSPALDVKKKLPVMLFIHGGAYKMFSPMAEPQFLLDEGNVVLVDLAYRLGPLGFLTTGDEVIPGNLGLKDQLQALRWLHENVEYFGGDPNTVTVFGDSAGGASTHILLLSPLSKGLLHRGISMSGTAACPWAMVSRERAADRAKALALLAGCPAGPSKELLKCLQALPLRSILAVEKKFGNEYMLPIASFGPIIEGPNAQNALLSDDPGKIESEIPWITGITFAEHLGYTSKFYATVKKNGLNLEEELDVFLERWLLEGFNIPREKISSAASRIKEFYFGNLPLSRNTLEKMDDIIGDGWFLMGLIDAASRHKGATYLYYYDYLQHNVSFASVIGSGLSKELRAGHQDDLLSIFPMTSFFPDRNMSETDLQVSRKMVYLWTHFAKYGNVSTNTMTQWEPIERNTSEYKYLYINATDFTLKSDLLADRVSFWRSLRNL
ncbi:unnamed protein product [Bemisia tabaci]|uniref:Carboxylic ester hydrolase n=1 Tax=Bemisia tabaci TaxID=7038 RepID=A0A9P0EZI8_BEMTA|nr:unnamed protein product [Bemisia tabaci]